MKRHSVARDSVLPLATLFLLGLVAALPLWGPGLLNTRGGGDSPFLLLRTHQLTADLQAGHFPARWMPDAAYGLGYPFFNYYAALPYYVSATFHLLGLNLLTAIKLTQTLFSIAAALGMYAWTRQLLESRPAGWLAGAAYLFAPFHLANLYVRGDSLSEFAAFAFYPLILWGLDHLVKRRSLLGTFPVALTYAGLILTHNVSALIFSPFVLLYLLAQLMRIHKNRGRTLGLGILALGLGLSLSAWFWLPALLETDLVQLTAQTSGYFFYGNHFRADNLVQSSLLFRYGMGEGTTPFAMGLVQAGVTLVAAATSIANWIRNRRVEWAGALALAGLTLSTFMITPLSRPLWDHVPLLAMTQFPWRFLSVQALFAAITNAALVREVPGRRWALAVALTGALAICVLGPLRPDYLPIAAEEVTPQRLQLYELFTGNVGSTIRYEYLPRSVIPRPWTGPGVFAPESSPQAQSISGELLDARETLHRPTRRVWEVRTGQVGARVAFPVYHWPGWRGIVDDIPVEVAPAPDSGRLTLDVPAGQHMVALRLGRTPLRIAAEALSLLALIAILIGAGIRARLLIQRWPPRLQARQLALPLSAVLLLALLALLSPRAPSPGEEDLTMDFEQMPFLHHNPNGLSFGSLRLSSYAYSSEQLTPDQALTITLEWEGSTDGLWVTARLASPAEHLLKVPGEWARAHVSLKPTTALTLPVPADVPSGPTMVTLDVEGPEGALEPRSPAGRTLGRTFLRPVWIEASQPPPPYTTTEMAGGAVRLHTLETSQTRPDELEVEMGWSAPRPMVANYGLSLRVTDPAGNEWARADTEPGHHFLPTGLWPPDRLLADRITLALPPGTPPGDEYTLDLSLYRVSTWEGIGGITATVPLTQVTFRPSAPVLAELGGGVTLSELEVPGQVQQGEALRWSARWLTQATPQVAEADWRLEGPTALSTTLPLAPGSEPSEWPVGAWVTGRAELSIPPSAPPGEYRLALTLRDATGGRLGSYTHPQPVTVEGREREWELPSMEHEVRAAFGDQIELAGYDFERQDGALEVTFYWQALAVPDRHYMLFVHVADPATRQPVAQVDTMPRQFTYPTGMWAAGEVISDRVQISLGTVPPGVYDLAVGWYDPDTRSRLEARNYQGELLPDGRAILATRVTVP